MNKKNRDISIKEKLLKQYKDIAKTRLKFKKKKVTGKPTTIVLQRKRIPTIHEFSHQFIRAQVEEDRRNFYIK